MCSWCGPTVAQVYTPECSSLSWVGLFLIYVFHLPSSSLAPPTGKAEMNIRKIICLKAKLKWWIVQVIWFHFHVYHDMFCCLTFFVKDILLTFTSLLNVSKHWMTNWNWTEMRYQWKSFSSLKKYILRSILILDLPPLLEQW